MNLLKSIIRHYVLDFKGLLLNQEKQKENMMVYHKSNGKKMINLLTEGRFSDAGFGLAKNGGCGIIGPFREIH